MDGLANGMTILIEGGHNSSVLWNKEAGEKEGQRSQLGHLLLPLSAFRGLTSFSCFNP